VEFKPFCCGEPWNFANWPAEFGKICRGKLWALVMIDVGYYFCCHFVCHATMVEVRIIRAVKIID